MDAEEFDSHLDELTEAGDKIIIIDEASGIVYEPIELVRSTHEHIHAIFVKVREL